MSTYLSSNSSFDGACSTDLFLQMLNAMNLLWAFNFSPAKDPITGHPIPIDLNAMNEVNNQVSASVIYAELISNHRVS